MPADFFIFPKVITTLKGRLLDITDIMTNVTIASNVVTFYVFDECFVQLLERCNTYVAILRDNSENTNILLTLHVSVLEDQVPELY
jgi:hypothetical protein